MFHLSNSMPTIRFESRERVLLADRDQQHVVAGDGLGTVRPRGPGFAPALWRRISALTVLRSRPVSVPLVWVEGKRPMRCGRDVLMHGVFLSSTRERHSSPRNRRADHLRRRRSRGARGAQQVPSRCAAAEHDSRVAILSVVAEEDAGNPRDNVKWAADFLAAGNVELAAPSARCAEPLKIAS